eukprot:6470506-Amphidinium_carterae.1
MQAQSRWVINSSNTVGTIDLQTPFQEVIVLAWRLDSPHMPTIEALSSKDGNRCQCMCRPKILGVVLKRPTNAIVSCHTRAAFYSC